MNIDLAMHRARKLEEEATMLRAMGAHDIASMVDRASVALRTRIDEELLADELAYEPF